MSNNQYNERFLHDGYLLLRQLIEPTVFTGLLNRVNDAVDRRARKLRDEGMISDLHEDKPVLYRWQHIFAEMGHFQSRRSWDEDIITPELFELMRHRAILDVLEELIGPEILSTGMFALRPKVPHDKRTEVLWHQDSHYLGADTANLTIVSVWIPLVPTDEENGCMQVIPGSQRRGLVDAEMDPEHHAYRPLEDPTHHGSPLSCDMAVGDVLMFSNLTFHRSLPNRSDHTRWSIDLRYHAADFKLEGTSEYLPGFLARSRSAPDTTGTWQSWYQSYRDSGIHTE